LSAALPPEVLHDISFSRPWPFPTTITFGDDILAAEEDQTNTMLFRPKNL